jgi:hypothetical protein
MALSCSCHSHRIAPTASALDPGAGHTTERSRHMEKRVLLDPTGEHAVSVRKKAPKPAALDGLTIGLLDIGKARGNVFLDRLDERFREQGIRVARYAKPTPSRLAEPQVRQRMTGEVQAAIIGLAD